MPSVEHWTTRSAAERAADVLNAHEERNGQTPVYCVRKNGHFSDYSKHPDHRMRNYRTWVDQPGFVVIDRSQAHLYQD